jgi:hypothetical protein
MQPPFRCLDRPAWPTIAHETTATFVSIFSLLLVVVTTLGLVAASNQALRAAVLEGKGAGLAGISHQFPIADSQLASNVQACGVPARLG